MMFRRCVRRDAMLLLMGASMMHLFSMFSTPSMTPSIRSTWFYEAPVDLDPLPPPPEPKAVVPRDVETVTVTVHPDPKQTPLANPNRPTSLPHTSIVHHAPGWTLFRNLYMSDGTLFILSNNRSFPDIRMMTSTGFPAENTRENIAMREPTRHHMDIITPEWAKRRWGERVLSVEGNTLLVNEPSQFLRHYYHLCAELFFGVQAFWHGAHSQPTSESEGEVLTHPAPPPLDRVIFAHATTDGWRDGPGFNGFFLRAAYPSLTVETWDDWEDRISATAGSTGAWRFPLVLLTDRSAAHRGPICGSQTQRIASEAWDYMRRHGLLMGIRVGGWWEPVRAAVLKFAGAPVSRSGIREKPMPERVVITYISRQGGHRRKLIEEDHDGMVEALEELVQRKNTRRDEVEWELNVLQAEGMTKDMQLSVIARTTFLLGVHGNGLTHLLFMPPTKLSAVIEIFYPGGFAHDYHWTARALGMSHFAVWNDTCVLFYFVILGFAQAL
ncbi:uncharacterized protein EV420DRAFT_1209337 [Desarmillaria tabescens]|uniref:Glycosyltransferase 61 catalytic domain-containing protein n=1 Tax=Armillaria tabescens TaxID=1929756 RepID=A0AA39JB33_ARMTA|nr:uncharacterized protein EV420DRAFT_1209337 [Desarmillaria tabescens]KAK0438506.1 hypothetical protein EV420DRAFT_1209337 [Desarmillaria tabescens]